MGNNGLSSLLGGLTQGIGDFGKSVVDMFGTGGAAIGDLIQSGGRSTKNQDDFRKWLYGTNSVKDASAKGLGTTLNGVNTVVDFIPGARFVSATPVGNAVQGAVSGLSDELKFNGENADWGKAGQRAALGATTGLAGGMAGKAFGSPMNQSLKNAIARGATTGAVTGGLASGGNRFIEGGDFGDVLGSTLQGAGTGAFLGGAGSAFRQFNRPQTYKNASRADIDTLREEIANAKPVSLFDTSDDAVARRNALSQKKALLRAYEHGFDSIEDYEKNIADRRARAESLERAEVKPDTFDPTKPLTLEGIPNDLVSAYGGAKNVQRMIDEGGFDRDNLVLYHGVSSPKLKLARDNLDSSIVNPSMQIVNPKINEGGDYGDIILLGNKDMLFKDGQFRGDSQFSSKPLVYDRDIYSPRNPEIAYNSRGEKIIEGTRKLYTPENVSAYMKKQGTRGVESNLANPGSISSAKAKQFKNLGELLEASDSRLKSKDEVKEAIDKYTGHVSDTMFDIADREGASTSWDVGNAIQDYYSPRGRRGDDYYNLRTGKNKEALDALGEEIDTLPTHYFEAKPERPIELSEFPGVVLPEGYADKEVLSLLEDNKVPIKGYYNPNEGAENDLQHVLADLAKEGNRFNTPYLLSLLTMLGGGAMLANNLSEKEKDEDKNQGVYY